MNHIEGRFETVRDLDVYHQARLPEDDPKAVLLIVHGLGEHSGRYPNVVDHVVPLGSAVYAYDHIGHGRSEGRREFVERFEDYLAGHHHPRPDPLSRGARDGPAGAGNARPFARPGRGGGLREGFIVLADLEND